MADAGLVQEARFQRIPTQNLICAKPLKTEEILCSDLAGFAGSSCGHLSSPTTSGEGVIKVKQQLKTSIGKVTRKPASWQTPHRRQRVWMPLLWSKAAPARPTKNQAFHLHWSHTPEVDATRLHAGGVNSAGAWFALHFEEPIFINRLETLTWSSATETNLFLEAEWLAKNEGDTAWTTPEYNTALYQTFLFRVSSFAADGLQSFSYDDDHDAPNSHIAYRIPIRDLTVVGRIKQTPPVCQQCGLARYSNHTGASSCDVCEAFSYSNNTNGTFCEKTCFDGEETAPTAKPVLHALPGNSRIRARRMAPCKTTFLTAILPGTWSAFRNKRPTLRRPRATMSSATMLNLPKVHPVSTACCIKMRQQTTRCC